MTEQTELFPDVKPLQNERDIVAETYELMSRARKDIINAYLDESIEGPFSLSFSGGKDSGLTLKLAIEAISSLPKQLHNRKIHIMCSNTKVENPKMDAHIRSEVKLIHEHIDKNELPFTIRIVSPDIQDSYFPMICGMGYRLPDNKSRYCTDRMKLKPQKKFLDEVQPAITIVGTRNSESAARSEKYTELFLGNISRPQTPLFCPIVWFTVDHVWQGLLAPMPWGSSLSYRMLYREASGECPIFNPKASEKGKIDACGARFGCWVCAVVHSDKSTKELAKTYPWMQPLLDWRELHMIVLGQYTPERIETMSRFHRSKELRMWEEICKTVRYISKAGYDRDGVLQVDKTGRVRPDWGTLTIEARRYLFDKLLEARDEVNEQLVTDGEQPIEIIAKEEIEFIENQLLDDKINRPWLSSGISNFGEVFERKLKEIKAHHHKYWNEEHLRCPDCGKRMKIIRPGVQECRKCKSKAKQLSLEV